MSTAYLRSTTKVSVDEGPFGLSPEVRIVPPTNITPIKHPDTDSEGTAVRGNTEPFLNQLQEQISVQDQDELFEVSVSNTMRGQPYVLKNNYSPNFS
jgi:hypothetical protein